MDTTVTAATTVWQQCLAVIQHSVNAQTFHTWFLPIEPVSIQNNTLVLEVPSRFYHEWLEQHYHSLLVSAVKEALGPDASIIYQIRDIQSSPGPLLPIRHTVPTNGIDAKSQLSMRYTFDNFVEGSGNQFARAAALAVAESPGKTSFNPLFIYGGVGLGKTHLLQAIGNHVRMNGSHIDVLYVSSERFTLDFITSIRQNKTTEFSSAYRSVGVLLLDDIQFFVNKERTQEEFFHTFNTLYHNGKQIVLTSDRPPRDLRGMEERLISRFQSGLVADIQPPDYETRLAILNRKAEANGIELDPQIYDFIATHVTDNIRDLEGSLIRLLAHSSLTGRDITLRMAKEVLRDIAKPQRRNVGIELIQATVADHFGFPDDLLRARTRKQEISQARQIAMYLAKKLTNCSLKTIGLHFGGRDHTTVIHAIQTVQSALESDPILARHLQDIERRIEIATL